MPDDFDELLDKLDKSPKKRIKKAWDLKVTSGIGDVLPEDAIEITFTYDYTTLPKINFEVSSTPVKAKSRKFKKLITAKDIIDDE